MTNTDKNDFNATIGNTVLCDGFLIPMTDFVNNVGNMENYPSHENALSWIYNYATFLKQPLKLEMFVPCDDEGNILEEPTMEKYGWYSANHPEEQSGWMYEEGEDKYYEAIKVYEVAKEKVLFELNSPVAVETMNYHISRNRNIEYLANFGSIKLTQNSLNAIFG